MNAAADTHAATLPLREDIAAARRVVVKVGSSSLTSLDGGLDEAKIGRAHV